MNWLKRLVFFPLARLQDPVGLILAYHGVTDEQNGAFRGPFGEDVSRKNFREQMLFLKKNFSVCSLEIFLSKIEKKKTLKKPLAAVTFDDGYKNLIDLALPVLEEHEIPATVFLSTAAVERSWIPFQFQLYGSLKIRDDFSIQLKGKTVQIGVNADSKKKAYYRIKDLTRGFDKTKLARVINEINPDNSREKFKEKFLSWEDVKFLSEHPLVTAGSHGHNHLHLNQVTGETAQRDIKISRNLIRKHTGSDVIFFAYPYGDYSMSLNKYIMSEGFSHAFTTKNEGVGISHRYLPYQIPRFGHPNLEVLKEFKR